MKQSNISTEEVKKSIKIYRIRRKRDGKFFRGSRNKNKITNPNNEKHDWVGNFYTTQFTATAALKQSGLSIEDHELICYSIEYKGKIPFTSIK